MIVTTREQRRALMRLYSRIEPKVVGSITYKPTYRAFRKTIEPSFDGSGCIMVRYCNMWIGIERDGYTHS